MHRLWLKSTPHPPKPSGTAQCSLQPPLHRHGAYVPPAPVQAPGGLLDGVALRLIGTGIRVVQQDITDVEHRLHPRSVLLNVSLQVLRSQESKNHGGRVEVGGSASKGPRSSPPPSPVGTALGAFPPWKQQHRLGLSSLRNPHAVALDTKPKHWQHWDGSVEWTM